MLTVPYEEEGNDGTDEINEQNIEMKVYSLLGYMMCPTCPTCLTFSYASYIGEKTVIIENRAYIPLYKKVIENNPDKSDTLDIPQKGELEQPPSLKIFLHFRKELLVGLF